MSEYSKQIGVAVTIALVGAFSLAIIANYSFPTQPGEVSTASTDELDCSAIPSAATVTTTTSQSAERVDRLPRSTSHHVSRTYLNTERDDSPADSRQWSQLHGSRLRCVQFSFRPGLLEQAT